MIMIMVSPSFSLFVLILAVILQPAQGQGLPLEDLARPAIKGYTVKKGICKPDKSTLIGSYTNKDGTLKECAKRCSASAICQGFNFYTDLNRCILFKKECTSADAVKATAGAIAQNFYAKKAAENSLVDGSGSGSGSCSVSTEGVEFYLAFLANRAAQPKNVPLEIWIAHGLENKTVLVSLEADPSMNFALDPIELQQKQPMQFQVPSTFKVTDVEVGINIERKAIRLSSVFDPFLAIGVNKELYTADAFLAIPSSSLGTRYIAACHWPPTYNCEFGIVATEDATVVKITLPNTPAKKIGKSETTSETPITKCSLTLNGKTYTNGNVFSLTLNRFDVAQIQDKCDLTGTIVESKGGRKIGVWSGNSRVAVGDSASRDHLVEQLFPVDTWGTDCAAWPTPARPAEHVDVWLLTAAKDDTRIKIDSSVLQTRYVDLNAGESVRLTAASVREWMYFSSDKVFQAAQISHSATITDENKATAYGDPSMTMCVPTKSFGNGYTFVTPNGVSSTYNNSLTIIATFGTEKEGFMLNNQLLNGISWRKIPGSNLVSGNVKLDSSALSFRIEHKSRETAFGAYIYGAGDRESYAYPAGMCLKPGTPGNTNDSGSVNNNKCIPTAAVAGDRKDNDCDGVIDEELCDGTDNDFDGQIDEDCYAEQTQ